MTIDRQTSDYLQNLENRIRNLEGTVRRLEGSEGKWDMTNALHPISTNLSNIREMFLLEIIREKGLLEGVDIKAITEKVTTIYAGTTVPWGAKTQTALKNIQTALEEITSGHLDDDED
ncbi:MAG: hypothetical protein JZU55_05865 [Afipia sp.]|nr:hypothetical protein [Afipia sp.]